MIEAEGRKFHLRGASKVLMVRGAANFSECRRYRYSLSREWDDQLKRVMFICLNPSSANENTDDNTVRRMIRFAHDWGYGGMIVMNLFAYISTDPDYIIRARMTAGADFDPVGPRNDVALVREAHSPNNGIIVAAWGDRQMPRVRVIKDDGSIDGTIVKSDYMNMIRQRPRVVYSMIDKYMYCLGVTRQGDPRHPLYMSKRVKPEQFFIPPNFPEVA